jgi:crotonobetainyl-CoA:carnitine CoA-transferase CaiB-like acyl-CoA transferase
LAQLHELPALLPPGQQSAFDYRMDAIPNVGQHTQAILNELGMTLD